jgi:hypothetical protein
VGGQARLPASRRGRSSEARLDCLNFARIPGLSGLDPPTVVGLKLKFVSPDA